MGDAGPIWPKMSLYQRLQQTKRIQCAEEKIITNINRSFSFPKLCIKCNVSLQHLVTKKVHFCSIVRLMKSALFRIILFDNQL